MITILVVDDSPVIRRLIDYTLTRNGYRVLTACDGREALDVMHDQLVDLVIADLAMPELDGLGLLRLIRADTNLRKIGLIMLTASGQDQDRIDAQAAGANDFLTKPTSSRDLLATVHQVLDTA
ncbi:MAG: response regulator [Roseiflexaceae bacterium]|nr:response regulator [Roseiflexaceae bacterium]